MRLEHEMDPEILRKAALLLERENLRLKKIVAELELDKSVLKEALRGKH